MTIDPTALGGGLFLAGLALGALLVLLAIAAARERRFSRRRDLRPGLSAVDLNVHIRDALNRGELDA